AVIAVTEESDPRWRWADLQTVRVEVPDETNAVPQVKAAIDELGNWTGKSAIQEKLVMLAPPTCLTDAQRQDVFELLKPMTRALAEGRALARYSTGRWPDGSDDYYESVDRLLAMQKLPMLMNLDAFLRAQDHDCDGALASLRAGLVAIRSVGDAPYSVAQQ